MRNFKILKTGIQTLFILAVIWTIFFIASIAYNKLENNNLKYIPLNAEVIIQVDATQLFKESIEGLLTTEDNEIIQLIKDLQAEGTDDEGKQTGIALNTNLLFFSIKQDNQNLIGAIFNITNQQDFRTYYNEKESIGIAANNEVGMVILLPESTTKSNSIAELLFLGKHADINFTEDQEAITIWTQSTNKKYNRLNIEISKEHLHINGDISNALVKTKTAYAIKPAGFHATTSIIPNQINDTIRKYFGDTIPKISGLSFNYFGTELIEEPEFLVAPEGDFLMEFESSINLDSYIQEFHKNLIVDSIAGNICYYGPKAYYSKQVSENLIYMGVHEYDSTKTTSESPLLNLTGDLSNLTNIQGGGFFKRILEIIPSYNASKQLADHIDTFDLKLTEQDENTIKVKGDIVFKKDQYASVEFIRFFLIGQFF